MKTETEEFKRFCQENPFQFLHSQMEKIREDILRPRGGIVSDEYVEFKLWMQGKKSRQKSFAEYIETMLPKEKYHRLLEVGCGRIPRLSHMLSEAGYEMTAMDILLEEQGMDKFGVSCIPEAFSYGKNGITQFDAVIAQEPCDGTEHIVRACMDVKKDFLISLCGVPHRLLNGDMPEDLYDWYSYLLEIGKGQCLLKKVDLIEGFRSFVLIGLFEK